jgi:Tol biopolymer transport system component
MCALCPAQAELVSFPAPLGKLLLAGLLLPGASTPASGQTGALTLAYQLTHSVKVDPSLAPDGQRMVFITAIAGREPQFVMNIEGTEAVQLTHDDADHEDPAWSPRGDKIAFVRIKDSLETMVAGRRRDPIGTRTIRSSR